MTFTIFQSILTQMKANKDFKKMVTQKSINILLLLYIKNEACLSKFPLKHYFFPNDFLNFGVMT